MLCRNCKKELPDESQFCPYCMTKFGEEQRIEASGFNSKKSVKKPVAIIAAVVCAALIIAAVAVPQIGKADPNPAGTDTHTSRQSAETSAQHGSAPIDKSLGFFSGAYTADSPAAKFFDSTFVSVAYRTLTVNEKVYFGAKIKLDCVVLKTDGKTAFVEYGANKGFDEIYNSTGDYAALVFSQPITDYSYGDSIICFGVFKGIDSYNIGGKSYDIPTIEVLGCTDFVYSSVLNPVFTKSEVTAAAKGIFGKNTVVRESVESDFADSSIADILIDGGLFYTAETKGSKYCLYAGEDSFIFDCASAYPIERYILPAVGSQNVFTYTTNQSSRAYTLECFDQNSEKLWQREFENAYNAVADYTSDYIYLVADANLYVIDAATGKDALMPRYVGNKCRVVKLEDSLLLISPSRSDSVM
ncbi:MAG: zinc ribbon domain-containing protein, partial [Clostridia bacterium]|nr:zinc ribbon domain-containing protein [Clostridia bacterium]